MNQWEALLTIDRDIRALDFCFDKNFIQPDDKESFTILDSILHYRFVCVQPIQELQLSVSFSPTFCDILIFPHPIILHPACIQEAIRFINTLNRYHKSHNISGRFYVEEQDLDVAFSARLSYEYIEALPEQYLQTAVVSPIRLLHSISDLLFAVCKGILSAQQATEFLLKRWS